MNIVQEFKPKIVSAINNINPAIWMRTSLALKNHNLEPELWLVPRLLGGGGKAVDVGANIGVYSMQFSRYAEAVDAFEPNPICLRQLEQVLPSRVTIHSCALSDRIGRTTLRFDPWNTGIGTIEPKNKLNNNPGIRSIQTVDVETRTIDSFDYPDVALIKIDAEGHEEAVLKGAEKTLGRCRPSLIVEIEERHNPGGLQRLRRLFDRKGYIGLALDGGALRKLEIIEAETERELASPNGINNFIFMDRAKAKWLFAIE